MRSAILLLLLATTALSCRKNDRAYPAAGSFLIAGHIGGFAGPAAPAVFYRIGNGTLRKDPSHTSGNVPPGVTGFNFNFVLPQSTYAAVADLPSAIPAELFSQNNADIGNYMPDAGAIDVRTIVNGITYRWLFEYDLSTTSPAIQQFIARFNSIHNPPPMLVFFTNIHA